jgi:hypothetical protein
MREILFGHKQLHELPLHMPDQQADLFVAVRDLSLPVLLAAEVRISS